MTDREERLIDLAAALSDGAVIDWDAAESSAVTDSERRQIRGLRLVRDLADSEASSSAAAGAMSGVHLSLLHPNGSPEGEKSVAPVAWGPLTVLEKIGRGRFGDVYRAREPRLDRDVALKLLRDRTTTDDLESLVIDEGRLLAKIRHPNVVTVYGAERIGGRVGVWMELVRGRTLEEELTARGPLPPEEVARIGVDICRALAAVHRGGLVHRDVKAQNVMRDTDGRLVLMDFGTGRELEAAAAPPELAGTPLYLAPEVIEGAPATPQSDVYGVGVLLFHLATGNFPVTGRSLGEIRKAHKSAPVTGHPALASVPRSLASVIERALSREPASRFESAVAMEHALTRDLGGSSRRRRYAAAVGLVAITAAAGVWTTTKDRSSAAVPGALDADRVLATTSGWGVDSISLDGRFAAGARIVEGTDQRAVAIRNLETGVDTLLRETATRSSGSPALSSDGRFVAYLAAHGRGAGPSLTVLEISSGRKWTLGKPAPGRRLRPLAWTPDDRKILVEARDPPPGPQRSMSLALVSAADGTREDILSFRPDRLPLNATLSPDGRWIAYARQVDPSASEQYIYVLDVQSKTETAVVMQAGTNSRPVWTPDGKHLLFVSDRDGQSSLWSIPLEAGRPTGRASGLKVGLAGAPVRVSASGRLLSVVTTNWGGHVQLVAERTTGLARVSEVFAGVGGRWSPDGSSVAFYRSRPEGSDVVVGGPHGERSFRGRGFPAKPPRWFPDGASLLVFSGAPPPDEPAGGSFYRLELATRRFTRLFARDTPTHQRSIVGSLTPDGRSFFLAARVVAPGPWTDIVRVDVATGRETHVLKLPGNGLLDVGQKDLGLAVSPDGRTLAIMAFSDERRTFSRIWTVDVGGAGFRAVTEPFPAWGTADLMDWTPDGASLLFVTTNPSGDWRVMRIDRDGGTAVPDGLDSTTLAGPIPIPPLGRVQPWTMQLNHDGSRILIGIPTTWTTEVRALHGILEAIGRR